MGQSWMDKTLERDLRLSVNLRQPCSTSSLSLQNYGRGHNPMLVEKPLDDVRFSTQQDLCYTQFEESLVESS